MRAVEIEVQEAPTVPSRFPGMDPYLEHPGWWQDFHQTFITYCRDALLDRVPDRYDVRVETLTQLVEIPEAEIRLIEPDLFISGQRRSAKAGRKSKGTATLDQVILRAPKVAEVRQHWIRVLYRPNDAVVTIIEVLSPSNKSGSGYHEYEAKRNRILARNVHLVELNLLVGGRRPEIESAWPPGDYYALIARAEQRPRADIQSWTVRDPLPTVPIPLRTPDPDVPLDLAQVFTTAYDRGRYARVLDYAALPLAPLRPEDQAWAAELARRGRPPAGGSPGRRPTRRP